MRKVQEIQSSVVDRQEASYFVISSREKVGISTIRFAVRDKGR